MPVSFNSPPRNFFLLGSGAQQALTNFFQTVNRTTGTDRFTASDIAYSDVDQKYILAGSGKDSNSVSFGWLEKQDYDETATPPSNVQDWRQIFESTLSPKKDVTLNFMKQTDSYGGDIIIGGKVNDIPWVARYDTNGAQQWVSSSFTGDLEYFGIACTSNGYYACGHRTDTTGLLGIVESGFVEKWSNNGIPQWGKSAVHVNGSVKYNALAANDRGEVVVVGAVTDQAYVQGYVAKLDSNTGDVLWDKTINSGRMPFGFGSRNDVEVKNVYIDGKDQVYVVGTEFGDTVPVYQKGFIIKYSAEGNLIWHKTTPSDENQDFLDLWSDTPVEQTVVLSRETTPANGNTNLQLLKYSKNGDIVFKRRIITDTNFVQPIAGLDGDPSFYYMLFVENQDNVAAGTSEHYTFGQVSASGNGFGDFVYDTNFSSREIDYTVNTSSNPIGRLADGSVRNDSSDLISYPYSGLNLLLGDDLATNVSYKKTRHRDKDLFEYSGSPAQRPVDFQELNLLGTVYSGSGDWLDQSGEGNDGEIYNASSLTNNGTYWSFDGTAGNRIQVDSLQPSEIGTTFTAEAWFYSTTFASIPGGATDAYPRRIMSTNRQVGSTRWCIGVSNAGRVGFGGSGGSEESDSLTKAIDLNRWYHVAVVHDSTSYRLYVDGILVATNNSSPIDPASAAQGLTIGGRPGEGNRAFAGRIGEVRIYKRTLTAAEIFQNYNATKFIYTGIRPYSGAPIAPGFARTLPAPVASYAFNNALCIPRSSNISPSTYETIVSGTTKNGAVFGGSDAVATGFGKVVVGARGDDNGIYTNGGRVFVYNTDGTGQIIITPSGPVGNDMYFGTAVDICDCNGKIAVTSASSLHIFDADGTGEILIDSNSTLPILPPGGLTFGNSVAISGDKVWVSDVNVPTGPTNNGTVYCFDVNTGAFLYQLRPKKTTGFVNYGSVIQANDNILVVGADSNHSVTSRNNTGRLYLYRQDGTNERIIEPNELTTGSLFGLEGIAIGRGLILAGAPRQQRTEDPNLIGSGEVFAFDYKGNKKFSVRPSDDPANENLNGMGFGGGIAISSDRIFIGAEYFQSGGGFAGKVYMFSQDGKKELQSFQGSNTIAGDNFGTSASASGGTLVIGSPTAGNSGKAYIYPVTNTISNTVQNLTNIQSTLGNAIIVGATFDSSGYLIFDGSNDYLNLDVNTGAITLTEADGWALEGWFRFPDPASNNTAGTWNYLFRDNITGGPVWEVGMFGANNSFEIKDNNSQERLFFNTTPNTWHFICLGIDQNGKLFLKNSNSDGSFSTQQSSGAASSGDVQIVKLFCNQSGSQCLNAHCGEIRIYDREIITPEFTVNYNATRKNYGI